MDAGQGEFSAVGFSYGASADGPVQSRAGGPIEDLGEEASSESSGMQQGSSNGDWLQHTLYPVADTHDTFTYNALYEHPGAELCSYTHAESVLQKDHVIATTCLFAKS